MTEELQSGPAGESKGPDRDVMRLKSLKLLNTLFIASLIISGWGKIDIDLSNFITLSIGGTTRAVFYLIFALYVAVRIYRGEVKGLAFLKDPLTILGIIAVISTAVSAKGDFFTFTCTFLPAIMGYYIASYLLEKGCCRDLLLKVLVAFTVLVVIRGFCEAKSNFFTNPTIMSTSSEHHTVVSMMIISVLPLSIAFLIPREGRKWYSVAALCILLLGLMVSNSRVGWFSFFMVMLYMALSIRLRSVKITLLVAMSISVAAFLIFFPHLHKRFLTLFNVVADPDFMARFDVWRYTLMMIRDHFLLGIGYSTDSFMLQGLKYLPAFQYKHPHNIFLAIFVFTGIAGYSVFMWIIWRVAESFQMISGKLKDRDAVIVIALKGGLLGFIMVNMLDNVFTSERALLLLFLLMAYIFFLRDSYDCGKPDCLRQG